MYINVMYGENFPRWTVTLNLHKIIIADRKSRSSQIFSCYKSFILTLAKSQSTINNKLQYIAMLVQHRYISINYATQNNQNCTF